MTIRIKVTKAININTGTISVVDCQWIAWYLVYINQSVRNTENTRFRDHSSVIKRESYDFSPLRGGKKNLFFFYFFSVRDHGTIQQILQSDWFRERVKLSNAACHHLVFWNFFREQISDNRRQSFALLRVHRWVRWRLDRIKHDDVQQKSNFFENIRCKTVEHL